MSDATAARTPPDPAPCWDGAWDAVPGLTELWLVAAMNRTVSALPQLHPWRLGDERGTSRLLQWTGQADAELDRPVFAVLAVTAREPDLPLGDDDSDPDVWVSPGNQLLGLAVDALRDRASEAVASTEAPPPQWVGVLTRFPGAWLPPLAVLPSALSGMADPGTGWSTESVDFDAAHRVHATDTEYAAAVLAPHVMAVLMDVVPPATAVTLAGDALHLWWPYRTPFTDDPARVTRAARAAQQLADAVPSFVLADHPDHSDVVQGDLDRKQQAAADYQEHRRFGVSADPVLQRIYSAARQQAGLPDPSGG